MKIVITGAAGFLGARLGEALLSPDSPFKVTELVLADVVSPTASKDPRVSTLAIDLTSATAAERLITPDVDVFFHLAAVVSGHAEADFDTGMHVNFDATRSLLEQARKVNPTLRFVFSSTAAAYGSNLPKVVTDITATHPQTSYGMEKAMCELLINDYARRKFVDGRFVRLPTVTVRPGRPNKAMTSFVSGIVREPLNGEESICPVSREVKVWIASPSSVVRNIVHAATIPAEKLGPWRGLNLPGITVSVNDILDALKRVAGEKVVALVRFERDAEISRMLESLPVVFDNTTALNLGFSVDKDFADIIKAYIRDDLKKA